MSSFLRLFFLSLIIFFFISCSRNVGYAVVLWPPAESQLTPGEVVAIQSQSTLDELYYVQNQGNIVAIPQWQVAFFSSSKQAKSFANDDFSTHRYLFARSLLQALPIREKADVLSSVIYRMRKDEILKIISQNPQEVDLGGLVNHWYKVLMKDGTQGWVFGYYLSIYDSREGETKEKEAYLTLLEEILETPWVPEWYSDLINLRQIDLLHLREDYGMFFLPNQKKVEIYLPSTDLSFTYESIEPISSRRFLFVGANREMEIISPDRIAIHAQQEALSLSFIRLHESINLRQIIQEEKDKRKELYSLLQEKTSTFQSDSYGKLSFRENGEFIWKNYERFIPFVIPEYFGENGSIHFILSWDSSVIRGNYNAALTFRFASSQQEVSFLISLEEKGMRMTFIPIQYVEENVIKRMPSPPFVAYFRY